MANVAPRSEFTWRTLREGMRLLTAPERRKAALLSGLVSVVEALQIAAVLLVLPVIGLIVEPDLLQDSHLLQRLQRLLRAPSPSWFVLVLGLAALVVHAASQISAFVVHAAIEVFTARTQTRLARELLAETVRAPYPWFLERNAAALVRLFHNDVALWGRDFVGNLLRALANAVTILAGVSVVLAVAPVGGVASLAVVGLVACGVLRLVRPRLAEWTDIKRRAAEKTMVVESQIFSGVKDIKVGGAEQYFVEIFASLYRLMSQASARGVILAQIPTSVLLLLGQGALLLVTLVLWVSGSRGGALASQITLIALVTYRVVPAVIQLARLITSLVNVLPWVGGILDLRASTVEAARQAARATGTRAVPGDWTRIHLRNVGFAYGASGREVVRDLSLSLERGKVYGVIGASGAGKSTFVDLVLGLLQPTTGRILLDDLPLTDIDLRAWQRRIGYVPQTPYFTDATIRANIAFGVPLAGVDEDRVYRCVEMAGLGGFVAALPRGLDTPLGDRALKISGGERQRIAIARALYRHPDILLLDEATSALDPPTQQLISRTLDGFRGRLTTVIVSHHMNAVASSDCAFLLEDGRLIAQGALDDIVLTHPSFGDALARRA